MDIKYSIKQYVLNERNSNSHRWYYFPNMTKSEVILFKQWDSDGSGTITLLEFRGALAVLGLQAPPSPRPLPCCALGCVCRNSDGRTGLSCAMDS